MEKLYIRDEKNQGNWIYYVEDNKAIFLIFKPDGDLLPIDFESAIISIQKGIEHAKELGLSYGIVKFPVKTKSYMYVLLNAGNFRVFKENGYELTQEEISMLKDNRPENEKFTCLPEDMCGPFRLTFDISDSAKPPFRFMKVNENGLVESIYEEDIEEQTIPTTIFKVDDLETKTIRFKNNKIEVIKNQ